MILIVDDKPENIFSLRKLLELHKFPVDTASSGEEALKKVLKNTYAVILLDVQMPDMDGFEVAEIISGYSKTKNTAIIFLSAVSVEKKFITKGYESGGIDYVTKPVDADILLLKIKTFYRLFEQTTALNKAQTLLKEEIKFRKEAESGLRESVQEMRTILETLPQIAFTAKPKGEIEFVNHYWFAYNGDHTHFPQTHPDEPSLDTIWKKTIETGEQLQREVRLKSKSGNYRYHLVRVIPVREGREIVKWVGTFTDIQEQKEAEIQKDEFLSIASHELKTPLTSIKGYIQLLQRLEKNEGMPETFLTRTENQVNKLDSLISDLLDVSKIESGKLQLNKKNFQFLNLFNNVLEMMRHINPDHSIVAEKCEDALVEADELRLEQVMINYIGNAVKYSPQNKTISVACYLNEEKQMVFKVKDKGIGIPADRQEHVFQKFFRAEESSAQFQGLGIGLYICAQIIRRHNGDVWLHSDLNEGSEFYFSIPTVNHN
jgi:signal transduction histidine kinase/DNA-binding response OmpR family regulator